MQCSREWGSDASSVPAAAGKTWTKGRVARWLVLVLFVDIGLLDFLPARGCRLLRCRLSFGRRLALRGGGNLQEVESASNQVDLTTVHTFRFLGAGSSSSSSSSSSSRPTAAISSPKSSPESSSLATFFLLLFAGALAFFSVGAARLRFGFSSSSSSSSCSRHQQ